MIKFPRGAKIGHITCDKCRNKQEYHASDWLDMLSQVRKDGWKIFKITPEGKFWKHYCPNCSRFLDKNNKIEKMKQQNLF